MEDMLLLREAPAHRTVSFFRWMDLSTLNPQVSIFGSKLTDFMGIAISADQPWSSMEDFPYQIPSHSSL